MDGTIDPEGIRVAIQAVGEFALNVRVAALYILGAIVFVIAAMN